MSDDPNEREPESDGQDGQDGPDELSLGGLIGLAPDSRKRVGEVVDGRYELIEVLGKGGMGVVYRAKQLNVAREVAVKVLRPLRAAGGGEEEQQRALERFDREMAITAQLEHPNIVRLYDVGQTGEGKVYMAMELLGAGLAGGHDRAAGILELICAGQTTYDTPLPSRQFDA